MDIEPGGLPPKEQGVRLARRRVLRNGIAAGGGLLAAPFIARPAHTAAPEPAAPPAVPPWMRTQGLPMLQHPYGLPSPYEKNVVRRTIPAPTDTAGSVWTPLQDLHGIITPNGLFYIRCHAGVPQIDPEQHRLLVHGHVDRPMLC